MDKDSIIWQYNNIKDLYLSSFHRLATTAILINSGGILLITTILSGDKKDIYNHILNIACFSFYPLKCGLVFFSIALFLCFLILFLDFYFVSLEFQRICDELQTRGACSTNFPGKKIAKIFWGIGIISLVFMILGAFFSCLTILTI